MIVVLCYHQVETIEREGKEKVATQVSSLDVQLRCMTEQCHKLTLELDEVRGQISTLSQQLAELRESEAKLKHQLETVTADREHTNNMLKDRWELCINTCKKVFNKVVWTPSSMRKSIHTLM